MEQNYELTIGRYFFELTKLFFQSIVAYYFKRDDTKLEALYYEAMDIHERYVEQYCDEEEKEERFKEKIYELLDLIALRDQKETIGMKYFTEKTYKGLKLRENIINDIYVELWLMGKELWLYIFERRNTKESLIPFDIEDPYLVRIDQVYYALKNKRKSGLLALLYKKEKK